jgi:WD40 repeat protein
MPKFHRHVLACFFVACTNLSFCQQDEIALSVQQGHTSEILLADISSDGRFLATYGNDEKIIFWDLRSGNQFLFLYFYPGIRYLQFESGYTLSLSDSLQNYKLDPIGQKAAVNDKPLFNSDTTQYGEQFLTINEKGITLYNQDLQKLRAQTPNYIDEPFTSVAVSSTQNEIYAACEDGWIYVYSAELDYLTALKGHSNDVNDLVVSADGKLLYSVSADRSIIEWNLETRQIQRRLSGKSYATNGASLSPDGTSFSFGDEIGFLKTITINNSTLELHSARKSVYAINHTLQPDDSTIIFAGNDNGIMSVSNDKTKQLSRGVNFTPKLAFHNAVTKGLDLYRLPYASVYDLAISPNSRWLVYQCHADDTYMTYRRIYDLSTNKKSHKIYTYGHKKLNEVSFLNDSVFFTLDIYKVRKAYDENSRLPNNALTFWKIKTTEKNRLYEKKVALTTPAVMAVAINSTVIGLLSPTGTVSVFGVNSGIQSETGIGGMVSIFALGENQIALVDNENKIHLAVLNGTKLDTTGVLTGHQDAITSCVYHKENGQLFTTSKDATVRIWDTRTFQLLVTLIPIGAENAIYITPDNYYMTTSKDLNSFGFTKGSFYFYPEQFDPVFNRPDVVLERLGFADSTLIQAYHQAYLKRIEKLGFTEEMLKSDFHLPELSITNENVFARITSEDMLVLNIKAGDSKYLLDRINVWVNDVAVYGTRGFSLRNDAAYSIQQNVTVPLAKGFNKIQVSVVNQAGAESYKSTLNITCTTGKEKPDLYIVTIGCSKFIDSKYDLNYAAKDAEDLLGLFTQRELYGQVIPKKILNEQVTLENIISLSDFFKPADINDEIIIFFAGHGVLDNELDYYLASHDMDFSNPAARGIPYSALENLVDGVAPLKKLIFIDACHSGEIDKSEIDTKDQDEKTENENPDLKFRKVGNNLQQKENPLGLQSTSQLTKSLFADLRKGTGATVISSAGGMEFAIESNEWQNGLFTYCLLEGIKSKKADLNKDGKIMLKELQGYVGQQVTLLSDGRQQPTSRIENNSIDYRIW